MSDVCHGSDAQAHHLHRSAELQSRATMVSVAFADERLIENSEHSSPVLLMMYVSCCQTQPRRRTRSISP